MQAHNPPSARESVHTWPSSRRREGCLHMHRTLLSDGGHSNMHPTPLDARCGSGFCLAPGWCMRWSRMHSAILQGETSDVTIKCDDSRMVLSLSQLKKHASLMVRVRFGTDIRGGYVLGHTSSTLGMEGFQALALPPPLDRRELKHAPSHLKGGRSPLHHCLWNGGVSLMCSPPPQHGRGSCMCPFCIPSEGMIS